MAPSPQVARTLALVALAGLQLSQSSLDRLSIVTA